MNGLRSKLLEQQNFVLCCLYRGQALKLGSYPTILALLFLILRSLSPLQENMVLVYGYILVNIFKTIWPEDFYTINGTGSA